LGNVRAIRLSRLDNPLPVVENTEKAYSYAALTATLISNYLRRFAEVPREISQSNHKRRVTFITGFSEALAYTKPAMPGSRKE